MSMHRGAEILCGIAANGISSSNAVANNSPNTPGMAGSPLKAVQTAASPDNLSSAYTLTLTSGSTSDTFVTGETVKGRWVVSDSAGNVITWPS